MTVDTKNLSGRRELHFETVAQIVDDAKSLAAAELAAPGNVKTIGNWSLGQIFQHLANAMLLAVHGNASFKVPFLIKFFLRLRRKKILNSPMLAGFQLSGDAANDLLAPETSTEEGLAALINAVEEMSRATELHPHPVFGKLNKKEFDLLQMRHAELHLSFVIPQ